MSLIRPGNLLSLIQNSFLMLACPLKILLMIDIFFFFSMVTLIGLQLHKPVFNEDHIMMHSFHFDLKLSVIHATVAFLLTWQESLHSLHTLISLGHPMPCQWLKTFPHSLDHNLTWLLNKTCHFRNVLALFSGYNSLAFIRVRSFFSCPELQHSKH